MFENDGYYGIEKVAADFACHLHVLSGLHVGIHDLRRTHVVSAGDNAKNICEYCKEKSAVFKDRCVCSDKERLNKVAETKQSMVYLCHMGLSEVIIPIVDENRTIGVIFLGQARTEGDSPSFEEMYQRLFELDPVNFSENRREKIRNAYDRTVVTTREKLNSLIALAEFIGQSIYVNRWLDIRTVTTEQNFRLYVYEGLDLVHIPLSALSIERIAEELNISYSQLNRLSRTVFGMPLKQYALNVKVSAAAHILLEDRGMSVSDVAYSVGIDNPHYFSRIFSDKMGMSCTEYRRLSEGND